VIGQPLNDHSRLGSITEVVTELVDHRDMVLVELATGYRTTEQLADWIRSLPAGEGTPERLRLPAETPSAVERAALYQAVAELIDPLPMRQLATLQTSIGAHTFVVETRVAILLDNRLPRRCLDRRVAAIEDNLPVATAIGWAVQLAAAGAVSFRSGRGTDVEALAARWLNGLGIALCDACAPDLQTVGGSLSTDAATRTFPG